MWGSIPALETIASFAFWVGIVAGSFALVAGAALTVTSDRIAALTKIQADGRMSEADARVAEAERKVAEANQRAEEAKAEAARVNERLQKAQEARRLTTNQIEELDRLFRSDVFQKPQARKLRVSSVEDAEARMFAMQFQNLMAACGVNIYPTDGGLPSTCVQLNPETSPLILTVKSGDVNDDMQHLAHFEHLMLNLGFVMKLEYDPKLQPDEGVLHVMRKAAA
ncbi:hypothetical protein [Sphingobium sp. B7D2B]|uniref:hypothetical protein n=1 Tax=Sphingobium sp. B7D2B TaxID=2940583 RepID=UPI00222486C3|nr:hypothetical protein [Sphingobium sp. B7D2B]